MLGLGGNPIYASNINMDETGLGGWTEAEFIRCIKQGIRTDNSMMQYPMLKLTSITDEEASAIWAYLQTVLKIENEVSRGGVGE